MAEGHGLRNYEDAPPSGRARADSFARVGKDSDGKHGQKPQMRAGREMITYARGDGHRLRTYEPAPVEVWRMATVPYRDAHFATFPPELVTRCLDASCPPGGVVLDPFGGACTTALVAAQRDCPSIMIELSQKYAVMGQRRLRAAGLQAVLA